VKTCRSFVLAKDHDGAASYALRARDVRRSARISCAMARQLLKAAYKLGPLEVVKVVPSAGRPTYWLRGGWRCGNGAGGAACWNVLHPGLNAIEDYGSRKAVTANV
jgi:hypothetical protein